jgi:hypothetical protein
MTQKLDHLLDDAVQLATTKVRNTVQVTRSSSISNVDEAQPHENQSRFADTEFLIENWMMDWGLDAASTEWNIF